MIFGAPPIITNGLVLNLDAANNKSYPGTGTAWRDLSGNNNTGTLTNGPTFNSLNGGSIVLDGTNDYIGWTTLPSVKWQNWNSLTIDCVFKLTSYVGNTSGRQYLFDFRDNGGVNGALGCFYDGSINTPLGFKLFYNTVGTSYEETLITTFSLNSIIHYQFTFDKTTSTNNIKHYINGVNIFNRSVVINSNTTNNGRVWIGRFSSGGYQWNGNIYSFKAYNRTLSSSEIQQNYNALKSRFNLR